MVLESLLGRTSQRLNSPNIIKVMQKGNLLEFAALIKRDCSQVVVDDV